MKGNCQIEGCSKKARYGLYHIQNGKKTWKNVCIYHESVIGWDNLQKAGGYVGEHPERHKN